MRKIEEVTNKGNYAKAQRPFPGVVGLLGVPGGFLGVGGGTSVSLLSVILPEVSCARCTSFTALRAASPTCVCGRSASTRESARSRSCGSVVEAGRVEFGGRYEDKMVLEDDKSDRIGCDRKESDKWRRAKRRSRSDSATLIVSRTECVSACIRSAVNSRSASFSESRLFCSVPDPELTMLFANTIPSGPRRWSGRSRSSISQLARSSSVARCFPLDFPENNSFSLLPISARTVD